MILQSMGFGKMVRHRHGLYSTVRLRWVDENNPERYRDPIEKTTEYRVGRPFWAAGKKYRKLSQLLTESPKGAPWYRDIYGREILHLAERFPCFDSNDYLYENRYFRDLFICEKDRLTRIVVTDEEDTFTVTEDVQDIKPDVWKEFRSLGYHTGAAAPEE